MPKERNIIRRVVSALPAITAALVLLPGVSVAATRTSTSTGHVAAPSSVRDALEAVDPAITFDDLPLDTTVTDQYAGRGVIFTSPVFTTTDGASPTSPVLSGQPRFVGDITAKFVTPGTATPTIVNGFSLDVGYIDSRSSVVVDYLDSQGFVVGSQYAQSFGINHLTITYRGIAGFAVRTVSSEPNGFAIDNLAINRTVSMPVSSMGSLGDSYSSGEGRTDNKYDCGTDLWRGSYFEDSTVPAYDPVWLNGVDCDTRTLSFNQPPDLFARPIVTYENRCHRNGQAYPNLIRQDLRAAPSLFVACSGAITDNIGATENWSNVKPTPQKPRSPGNVAGGNTQLTDLVNFRTQRLGGHDPSVITIGIGGNDAQFRPLIEHCLRTWVSDCKEGTTWADSALSTINGDVFDRLVDTFATLRHNFPASTLLVFGYVNVINPGDTCGVSTGFMDANETRFLGGTVLEAINQAVSDAAADAGAFYVDISPVTDGHGVCDADPWVNGIIAGDTQQSFHPNVSAHEAIARYFRDHYTDGHGNLLVANPDPSGTIRPQVGHSLHLATLDGTVVRNCGASCLQPAAACVQACQIQIQGNGYAPGAELDIVLHSAPVNLGHVTADEDGRIDTTVTIPQGTEPGLHYLAIDGAAPDGSPQEGTLPVNVYATAPPPRRVHPAPPAAPAPIAGAAPIASVAPKPSVAKHAALGVKVRAKRKGALLTLKLTCPRGTPSSCRVVVKLQRRRTTNRKTKFVTLTARRMTVRAGRTAKLVLRRSEIRRVRKRLRLSISTTTTYGTKSTKRAVPR